MSEKAGTAYLDYLDKEMTIMGILSTFCVAVVALALDRVGSADPGARTLFAILRSHQWGYVLLGSLSIALASMLFYAQRSALAWFYGQISLSIEVPGFNGQSTHDWYRDADSWATWVPYQGAFTMLTIGSALYLYSLAAAEGLPRPPSPVLWAMVAFGLAVQGGRMLIYRHYKYEDDPIKKFRERLRRPATSGSARHRPRGPAR